MDKWLKYPVSATPSEIVQMTKLGFWPFNCMKTWLFYTITGVKFKITSTEHIRSMTDGVGERVQGCGGTRDIIRLGSTAVEVMAVENERNDMGRGRVEYFCIHKLDSKCSSWELNTFSVLLQNVAWCQISQRSVAEPHLCHVCTYSCLKASTCSMVVIPARAKLSLYWLILMDSSHSGTDLNMVPSQPLVLGRRMDTLWETKCVWITHHLLLHYVLWVHVMVFEQGGTSFTVNILQFQEMFQ